MLVNEAMEFLLLLQSLGKKKHTQKKEIKSCPLTQALYQSYGNYFPFPLLNLMMRWSVQFFINNKDPYT